MLCGKIEKTRKKWALFCITKYKKEFGIDHNQQFDKTVSENESEFALLVHYEIESEGITKKLEDYERINKWLMIACYFNTYETKTIKNKMQFYIFLLFFQYCNEHQLS